MSFVILATWKRLISLNLNQTTFLIAIGPPTVKPLDLPLVILLLHDTDYV